MIRKIEFNREKTGKWHADLPEWEGPKESLEMTMGADNFLDLISQGEDTIYAELGDEKIPGSNQMILLEGGSIDMGGAWYFIPSINGTPLGMKIWIGETAKFVFDQFPETLWFRRLL